MNDPNPTGPYQPATVDEHVAATPQYIARYRIEKNLGQGGFGIVYLAFDDQLERHVAIKVPHRHRVSNSQDAQAYLSEARTVANLDHVARRSELLAWFLRRAHRRGDGRHMNRGPGGPSIFE